MAGIERFIAQSVKDTGADEIVAALLGKVTGPRESEVLFHEAFDAAKVVVRDGGDVEMRIDIDYE